MKNVHRMIQHFEVTVAVLLCAAGLFCLWMPAISADALMLGAGLICTVSGLLLVWEALQEKRGLIWMKAAGALILALIFWMHRYEGESFVSAVFALYMFFTSIIFFVQGFMDLKERSKAGIAFLAMGLADLVLALVSWYASVNSLSLIQVLIGLYLLMQGLQLMLELFLFRRVHSSRAWSFRYWSSLPVYIVAAGPSLILRYLQKHRLEQAKIFAAQRKNSLPVSLRVFIHTGLDGDHQFGHMTFSWKGIMYSYGNYDVSSEKLFRSYGPGILFTAPSDIYVNNCCLVEDSTLFEFGLYLTKEQQTRLEYLLDSLFMQTYRWYCPLAQSPIRKSRFEKLKSDYSCRLYWRTGSKFYKFRHGQWKNYWVFGTNCSLFASSLLHSIDREVVIPRKINTPGEYFEYFMEAYEDPASNVVSRSAHSASDPDSLFDAAI